MKNIFPEYFIENKNNLDFEDFIVALDANVILNLYRYSEKTRDDFLDVLGLLDDKVWVPHQAAKEFLGDRRTVIKSEVDLYKKSLKQVEDFENDINHDRRSPFVSEETFNELNSVFEKLKKELVENKNVLLERNKADNILEAISTILDGKIGDYLGDEQIDNILKEGKERYDNKVPPGYKDKDKNKDSSLREHVLGRYGDLIIWKEIIKKSAESEKDVLFVTDDIKEDWWDEVSGEKIGPRVELKRELLKETGNSLYMMTSLGFLGLASQYLEIHLDDSVSVEIENSYVKQKENKNKKYGLADVPSVNSLEAQHILDSIDFYSQVLTDLEVRQTELLKDVDVNSYLARENNFKHFNDYSNIHQVNEQMRELLQIQESIKSIRKLKSEADAELLNHPGEWEL